MGEYEKNLAVESYKILKDCDIAIEKIKEFKCQAKSTQKKVTQFKNKCIDTFKECKKKEDKSVESVYFCMHDHSMKFINQTTESLANAAAKNSKTALERAEIGGKNVLQLQEYLEDFDKALLF